MQSFISLKEIIDNVQKRKLGFVELADEYLRRIKAKDEELHAFLSVDEDAVRAAAKKAEEQFDGSATRPLYGIPYATKDNILVKDLPATAGSRMLENYRAPYDATVTARLRKEGAIVLGKTNMDEFAMGSSTENSAYGATKNPVDPTRVPGGSSGGSAAAVAAGFAPFALGSDTGGSIRQPAAFCGVVGFKPTYGAVSRHGLIAMASSLDQIGTFTRSVEDAKLVVPYLFGSDEMDATSHEMNPAQKKTPKDLTIGVVKEYFGEGLDGGIKKSVETAIERYKEMGATVKEVSIPHALYGLATYYILMSSEVSSNLARYDGIRYGSHLDDNFSGNLLEHYFKVRGEGFGPEVRRRIMLGTYTLSSGYYEAYYAKAQKVQTLIRQDFEKVFHKVDLIFSPTTPTLPFKFGERTQDPLAMYLSDIYNVSANLAGVPAISIPVGTAKEDNVELPVGMQIMGPQKKDWLVLEAASWYETSFS